MLNASKNPRTNFSATTHTKGGFQCQGKNATFFDSDNIEAKINNLLTDAVVTTGETEIGQKLSDGDEIPDGHEIRVRDREIRDRGREIRVREREIRNRRDDQRSGDRSEKRHDGYRSDRKTEHRFR